VKLPTTDSKKHTQSAASGSVSSQVIDQCLVNPCEKNCVQNCCRQW
jgi:hypothetical protein